MPDTIAHSSFAYTNLDTDTAQFVQQQTSEIKGLFKQTVENIIAIGQRLLQVKECLPYGQWLDWLAAEFDWAERTAHNYMRVAQQFRTANFADLNIAASALYLLAAPSTPEEAREEALARAHDGERITVSSARELRDKYAPPKLEAEVQDSPLEPVLQPESGSQPPQPEPPVQQPAPAIQFSAPSPVGTLPRIEPKAAPSTPPKRKRAKEEKPLVVAPKRVRPGEWWKLGNDNYLYCGDPTSAEFQKNLAKEVAFSLAFPTKEDWQFNFLSSKARSSLVLHTVYEEDQDLSLLRAAIEKFLQLYTDGGDTIVLSFLPDPAILPLIEQLDCPFFCADPDPKRCDAAIRVWLAIGQTAERMKSRQGKKRLSTPALTR